MTFGVGELFARLSLIRDSVTSHGQQICFLHKLTNESARLETYKGVHWNPLIGTGKASSSVCLHFEAFLEAI